MSDIYRVRGMLIVGAVFKTLKRRYLKLIYQVENWYTLKVRFVEHVHEKD